MNRLFPVLGGLSLWGCVLPADEPTGLELSWRFVEVNTVDGEEAQRLRSCEGGQMHEVVFSITDTSDAERTDTFRYPCAYGFQTPTEFQTESSDAFIELKPRGYEVLIDLVSTDVDGAQIVRRARNIEVDVLERSVTLQDFDFGLEPVEVTLSLAGLDACDAFALTLRYADPERALAEPPRTDGGTVVTELVYRERLETMQGVSLAGGESSCGDAPAEHTVAEVDPGAYILDVSVDGVLCPVDLTVGPSGAEHVIDLANLPCDG
ncbi:MAG: hypothetical protein ACE37F_16545 [Nannocystaceae bacterium]